MAVVLEYLLFTFLRPFLGPYLNPVLFFASSWAVAGLAWRTYQHHGPPVLVAGWPRARLLALLAAVGVLGVFGPKLWRVIQLQPIDLRVSDVIPSVQIYVHRLLQGQPVYTYFTQELGYELFPTYLPALWLPFVLPEVAGFDYRWLAVGVLVAVLLAYFGRAARQAAPAWELAAKLGLPLLLLFALLKNEAPLFRDTVEELIIGYYLLLALSLFSRSPWLQALPLVLCLLSRFSLVLWVPLWLLLLAQQRGRGHALRVAGGVALGLLALYVVPFLSHNWDALALGQQTYLTAAVGEWQRLLPATQQPEQLYQGLGFAAYFHAFGPGDVLARIELLRLVQGTSCLLIVVAAGVYWFRRRPQLDYRLYALLVLKVYLATFYAFVQVPYIYLTALVPFLTVPVLLWARLARPAAAAETV